MLNTGPVTSLTQAISRIQIQAINIDFEIRLEFSTYCLKLLLNNKVHQWLKEVAADQPLHWDDIKPIDAKPNDYIELRIYEVGTTRKFRVASVGFRATQVDCSSTEIKVLYLAKLYDPVVDKTADLPCSVRFTFSQEMALRAAADRQFLGKLMTLDSGYHPSAGCLEGTRKAIRNDIHQWVDSGDASKALFWLYGRSGCGKSTVAQSICKELDETGRLAGAFFCKRDSEYLGKPENVVSTLAANLACAIWPYREKLVATLREKPELAKSALAIRFRAMIVEPIQAISKEVQPHTWIIVVDALDECGTPETQLQLTKYLFELSQLTPWLQVILTSQPSEEITHFFQTDGKAMPRRDLFQEDPASVTSDITLYIRHRLAQMMDDDETLIQGNWLENGTAEELATRANGLFIWAQTVCYLIQNSQEPNKKIRGLLHWVPSSDVGEQLSSLYKAVLDEAVDKTPNYAHIIRSCMAAVIVTRIPISDTALATLLNGRVSLDWLRGAICRLGPVLRRDYHGSVRVLHQSFSEYMLDEQCPPDYRVNIRDENLAFATSCLQIMIKELKFNICELEDSTLHNHEVPDLVARIQTKIPSHLEYSCLYWTSHLVETFIFDPALQEHQSIVKLIGTLLSGPRVLYWVEALSLLERLNTSETGLLELIDWMQDATHNISIWAEELQRFVTAYYSPISQNTPHLYVSAVAFGSQQFDIIRSIADTMPNTLRIARGSHLGKVSSRRLRVIPHSCSVEALAYSPDGKVIVTSSGNTVQVWDARTGAAMLNPLEGHSGPVTSVAISPDGKSIASGSADRTVRLWDLRTGAAAPNLLESHFDRVTSVAFSPDNKCVASGSHAPIVKVWDLRTGTVIHRLRGHAHSVTSIAFSPDGQHMATGSYDTTVRVWDLRTGAATLSPLKGHTRGVASLSFSPDGLNILACSCDDTVHSWDLHTGAATLTSLQGCRQSKFGSVRSAAFSPNGQYLAAGLWDRAVRVWDIRTGATVLDISPRFQGGLSSPVAFSPDSRRVVFSSDDKSVQIWNMYPMTAIQGHSSDVTSVAVSPDGQRVASGSDDNTVRVWDLQTGVAALDPLESHSDRVNIVAFSPNSQHVASSSGDKTVRVWDLRTGADTPAPLQGRFDRFSAAFSPDMRYIASGSSLGSVQVWDLRTGATILNLPEAHSDQVACVAFSPDGQRIVSGSSSWDHDKTVRVWDLHTGSAVIDPLGHSGYITSVAFSPDGQRIASGFQDNTVRVWDLRTRTEVLGPLKGHSSSVTSVAFSPDGQRVASGSYDNTVRVWDLRTGTDALGSLEGHSDPVTSIAFSPNGRHVVSGSMDFTVRVWDVLTSTSPPCRQLPQYLQHLNVSTPHVMSYQLAESLSPEGWVLDQNKRPLFWLPKEYQRQQVDTSLLAISRNPQDHPVSFDFSKFKYGTGWMSVCDSTMSDL